MDSVLPSVLAVTVLLLSSLMLGRSGFASFRTLSDSLARAQQQNEERIHSSVSITSVNRVGAEVDVVLENGGTTRIADFSKVDVVAQYASGGSSYAEYLTFTTATPQPDDSWSVVSITDDAVDPRVLNQGERMTMRLLLNPAPDGPGNWLQVTSEQGASASAPFD